MKRCFLAVACITTCLGLCGCAASKGEHVRSLVVAKQVGEVSAWCEQALVNARDMPTSDAKSRIIQSATRINVQAGEIERSLVATATEHGEQRARVLATMEPQIAALRVQAKELVQTPPATSRSQ